MKQPAPHPARLMPPPPVTAHGALWPDTQPMLLEPDSPPLEPTGFREALHGLHVRELDSDTLFQLFFGPR